MKRSKPLTYYSLISALAFAGAFCYGSSTEIKQNACGLVKIQAGELSKSILFEGNKRFIEGETKHTKFNFKNDDVKTTSNSPQTPLATIVSCSDSRVCPEFIFDAKLGEIFSIRNAGGVAGGTLVRSLEYAVSQLKVPLVLFIAHTDCGTVHTAIDYYNSEKKNTCNLPKNIEELAKIVKPSIAHARQSISYYSSRYSFDFPSVVAIEIQWRSIEFVLKMSPVIRKAIEDGKTSFRIALYDMKTGKVTEIDSENVDKKVNRIILDIETANTSLY